MSSTVLTGCEQATAVVEQQVPTNELIRRCGQLRTTGLLDDAEHVLAELTGPRGLGGDLRVRLETAQVAAARGKVVEAVASLRDIQRLHPANLHAFRIEAELLIQTGELDAAVEALERAPAGVPDRNLALDTMFKSFKLRIRRASGAVNRPLSFASCDGPANEDLVAVMMVRDEDHIVGDNLEHHHRVGFRKFVILNNLSTDQTAARIADFRARFPDSVVAEIYVTIREQSE